MTDATLGIPLTPLLWIAAFTPILILLVLLVWRQWTTSAAAPVALAVAVVAAFALFGTPLETLAVAAGKGIWDAVFILYVIWPSLILYQVADEAGAFGAIQKGMRRIIPDRLLLVLTFAWVLASFIQGIAGFGTPLAVTTPLLVGLGMRPVYAVLLPLIGTAWGNVFGSLGVPWFATLTVVDLADPAQAAFYAGLLVWIPNLTAGLAIAWIYGRTWALKRGLPAILVVSLVHGGLQLALVPFVPAVATFLATGAALGAVFALSRSRFYRQLDEDEPTRIFTPTARTTTQLLREHREREREESRAASRTEAGAEKGGFYHPPPAKTEPESPRLSLALAFAPYLALAALAVVALMLPPVRGVLEVVRVGIPFPETVTGYGVERPSAAAYAAFTPLTHPGTLLLIAAAAGYALYRARGLYPEAVTPRRVIARAATAALPATTAITALLLLSKVMDHSGEITVLALGVSAVAPALAFVGASNLIGVLGTLLTSSSTASNLLFAPLQETTALAEGIPPELVVAAQMTGSAVGGAIGPGDVLLGATVAGIPDKPGAVLALAIPWALATGALVGAATLALFALG